MQERYSPVISQFVDAERICSFVIGLFFLAIGIAGFIPSFVLMPEIAYNAQLNLPSFTFTQGYGNLLGLFPTNYLHNAVHIVVGILGIASATSFTGAMVFNRGFAIVYTAIALMGLLPMTNTTFGTMPIFGNNVWLNALTAAIAGYYGFYKPTTINDIGASPSA